MEKLILALVITTRRLRPYFQAHTIEISTEHPMKQILHKPETSGSMARDEVILVMISLSWMDPIWDYLLNEILPSDSKEASKLRARLARFALLQGTRYKQGFSAPLLKCIGKEDTNYVLREMHEGICGNHIVSQALAGKTLRQGYY